MFSPILRRPAAPSRISHAPVALPSAEREAHLFAGPVPSIPQPGVSLEPAVRADMEARFGHSFANVRVHADDDADRAARSVNALAYTSGRDVVFRSGHYDPHTSDGDKLLAHELTHVVQQQGVPGRIQRQAAPETKREEPAQFAYSAELDPELRARFNRMVLALKARGISFGSIDDVRPRRRSHILSTGYHIRELQAVTLTDLQALKDGKDQDGNVWFKDEWKQESTWFGLGKPRAATDAEIMEKAKAHALELVLAEGAGYAPGGKITCAYEGYEPGDASRKPDVDAVPISNHVTGHAIDLSGIQWDKLGGPWSTEARSFVSSFGLTRPYSPEAKTYCIKEHWHFELAPKPSSP